MEKKMKEYFMQTKRIGFSRWEKTDLELAMNVWGEEKVTHYLNAKGIFTKEDIKDRLQKEIDNQQTCNVQYWPIFTLDKNDLIGASGLRPFEIENHSYEIGFHLKSKYWGQGYAFEAGEAVINFAFHQLHVKRIIAGHHPDNVGSKKVVTRLGFTYIGQIFYEPTGLSHPAYELLNPNYAKKEKMI